MFNNTAYHGGGIYLNSNNGYFSISGRGSVVSRNDAYYEGGGIFLNTENGYFSISGGSLISENTAAANGAVSDGCGGGIYLQTDNFNFYISSGSVISGNTADYGGGIYLYTTNTMVVIRDVVFDNNTVCISGECSYEVSELQFHQ